MPAGHNILILAMTGLGDDLESNGSGFDHCLVKPVDVGALERLLQTRMGG